MTEKTTKELKAVGGVLLALCLVFNTIQAVSYISFRRTVTSFLGVVEFDVNSRAPQIREAYAKAQAEAAAAQAAANAAKTATTTSTSTSTSTSTTVPQE